VARGEVFGADGVLAVVGRGCHPDRRLVREVGVAGWWVYSCHDRTPEIWSPEAPAAAIRWGLIYAMETVPHRMMR
jgi:hypothetical protein